MSDNGEYRPRPSCLEGTLRFDGEGPVFVTIFRKDGETLLAKELHQHLVILDAVNHHLASQPTAFAEP